MIGSLFALLALQLLGTLIVQVTGIALPGPVVGLMLLFVYLLWRGDVPTGFARTAHGLIQNLALLFVPAGVGLIVHLHEVADQWLALTVTLVSGAAITLLVTAATLHWLIKRSIATDYDNNERSSSL